MLLLDEPLGALDLKLRQEMQIELKRIQREVSEVGITFVYVTHDQEEALTMSDRIAVFNEGRIEQIGAPAEVYERPATEFVAGFVGVSNVLERDGRKFTVRPEKIRMHFDEAGEGELGRIRDVVYVGMFTRYVVELDSAASSQSSRQNLETSSQEALESRGRRVRLEWRARAHLRDPTRRTGMRRIRKRHVLVAALAAALCVPASGAGTANGLPSKIGKGEGKLTMIAWEGYLDAKWVKPFVKQTGCKVQPKYAGSSDEMVTLMRSGGGGQYDMVSASGDASLRLIYGKDVQPVNVSLVPGWKQFFKAFQSPAQQHRRAASTTASRCSGARTRSSTTQRR